MPLTAIILTFNEERHLARCIESLKGVADRIVVADCFSTDATLDIARAHGARVVLSIDADEVLTPELAAALRARLPTLGPIDGVTFGRRMTF